MMLLVIQLVSGLIGGNLAGALLKKHSLGQSRNSMAGILGGAIAGQFLAMMDSPAPATADVAASSGLDMATILVSVVASGAAGGLLMVLAGLANSLANKR